MPKVSKHRNSERESSEIKKFCQYCKNHSVTNPEKGHKGKCNYKHAEHIQGCHLCKQNYKKTENVRNWRNKKNIGKSDDIPIKTVLGKFYEEFVVNGNT